MLVLTDTVLRVTSECVCVCVSVVCMMTLVRERRHQKALSLSLPPPIPGGNFRHHQPLSSSSSSASPLSSTSSSNSPIIDNLPDLERLVVLGHGNGGTVYKVRHRHTMAVYALKVVRLSKNAPTVQQQAACEAEILKRVDSEFIVRCHGVFDLHQGVGDTDNVGDLCFVMEYMEAGSLHDVLLTRRRLPEKAISVVAKRVLEGLRYLHNMQIVHRDIKPSNLLINNRGEIKIADFGVSQLVAGVLEEWDSYMGTCAYMSPERFDRERWNAGSCSVGFAGDVWSLGVVVLECHVGRFPLISPGEKPDWATLMCAICLREEETVVPESASPEFQSFVWRCLEKDWRVRGTVEELLDHPFLSKYCCSDSSELALDA